MTRAALVALVAILVSGASGCGSGGARPDLVVSAASSLTSAFTSYASQFKAARVRLSFGGSDELAARIRAGGTADVFAAANTALPEQLYREGRVEKPVDFTANRLVLAVPAGSHVTALADLAGPGMKVAVGSPSVPIGEYTRQVLARVAARQRERILANVKTEEPEVTGIVGKLTQGAVDAGFVYATDVQATRGALRAIRLPDRLQPSVRYAAAVVRGSAHRTVARRFVAGLVDGAGKRALRAAGFEPVR